MNRLTSKDRCRVLACLVEFEIETEVNQIGPFKIVRLGADEQNIDEETESWMTQDTRNNNWNGPFSDRYSAEQFAREAIPSKPLWQMDVRHRLDLRPGRTDPVSMPSTN